VSVKTIPNHAPRAAFSPGNGSFRYDEILAATNCFSESNLLGEGGFGYVYKGVLPCGKQIAVKQLKLGSQQGEREFQAEVETISRVHHKHLVELVGYCVAGAERMLVYEFVPNNTLEFHLHGKSVIYGNPPEIFLLCCCGTGGFSWKVSFLSIVALSCLDEQVFSMVPYYSCMILKMT